MKPAVYSCGATVSVPVPLPVGPSGHYGPDVAWHAGEIMSYRINGSGGQVLTVKLASGRLVSIAAALCRKDAAAEGDGRVAPAIEPRATP